MSDGDNATPGRRRRRAPEDDSDNLWVTRSPQPLPGAAPWERLDSVPSEEPADDGPTGNHADGIAVADLIAKIAGTDSRPRRSRHRLDPAPESELRPEPEPALDAVADPEPPAPPTEVIGAVRLEPEDYPADDYARNPDAADTEVIPVWPAPAPDLSERQRRPRRPAHIVGVVDQRRSDTAEIAAAQPRHQRARLAGRAAAALLAVLALVLTGGAWQWQTAKNNLLNKVAALDPNSRDILDPNAQFGDENFLIVGVDSRYGQNADMGAGNTSDADGARSDTIMLVNIPANRERVVAVSFPRDLSVSPIECEPWNPETAAYGPIYDEETGTYGPDEVYTETKLNSAFAYGGPKCLVKVVQKISGL